MTDPELWARLQAVRLPGDAAGQDWTRMIEAGLTLKPGRGATLWQEYLAAVYLEARCRRKPKLSQILQDLSDWIVFEHPALQVVMVQAAGLDQGRKPQPMSADETAAAYLREMARAPLPQVWPREMPGKGRRTARGIGVAFIMAGAVWRLAERQIQVEAFHVIPTWLPLVLATLAGGAALAFAPRRVLREPADAWEEGEASR